MTMSGALGFYLGIDTPPPTADYHSKVGELPKIDVAELLSAVGKFSAALSAFASTMIIVLRDNAHRLATIAILSHGSQAPPCRQLPALSPALAQGKNVDQVAVTTERIFANTSTQLLGLIDGRRHGRAKLRHLILRSPELRPAQEASEQLSFRYGHFPWLTSKTAAMDRTFDRVASRPLLTQVAD